MKKKIQLNSHACKRPVNLGPLVRKVGIARIVRRRHRLTGRGRLRYTFCPCCCWQQHPAALSFSLVVDTAASSFRCLRCDAEGDAVSFMQRAENLSFREAVKRIAEMAGLPVPELSVDNVVRLSDWLAKQHCTGQFNQRRLHRH